MKPKIFYYCANDQSRTSGQEHAYRHIETLARNGYQAFAWHQECNDRLAQLKHRLPIVDTAEFERLFNEDDDYLVLPEKLSLKILGYPGKKVIFHESLDRALSRLGEEVPETYPYAHPSVIGAMVTSEHNYRHLKFSFPQLPVHKVGMAVDPQACRYRPLRDKRKLITWIAGESAHLSLLYHVLQARAQAGLNEAFDYRWVSLADLPAQEIPKALEESLLFISLGVEEGFAQAPLEAMLSGCLVAGYQTGPVEEYPPVTFQCEYGEHIEMIQFIEKVMASFPDEIEEWTEAVESRRRQALDYTAVLGQRSVLRVWERILFANPPKTSARTTMPAL